MKIDRRSVLALSGGALAAGLLPAVRALAAAEIKSLTLIEPLGKPSVVWTAFDLIRPAVQKDLGCEVALRTVPGHDGFDAIRAVLASEPGAPALFGSAIMGTQYAERLLKAELRIESLMPIVKLTNGFSVALFAKQGGALKAWADVAAAKPLKVSSLERATAAYVAELMMERKGGIATEVTLRDTIPEVIADVIDGRSAAGLIPTTLVTRQLDRLRPIVTFGAARNAVLAQTPTFAEVTGNRKLAFTESVGVFASRRLAPAVADRLIRAFVAAGQDPDIIDRAEAEALPLAVGRPEVLIETMKRNGRVLQRILG
jgi:tripartite-type tricarboxylate transporter receptor subunit TctC